MQSGTSKSTLLKSSTPRRRTGVAVGSVVIFADTQGVLRLCPKCAKGAGLKLSHQARGYRLIMKADWSVNVCIRQAIGEPFADHRLRAYAGTRLAGVLYGEYS